MVWEVVVVGDEGKGGEEEKESSNRREAEGRACTQDRLQPSTTPTGDAVVLTTPATRHQSCSPEPGAPRLLLSLLI